MMHEEGGRTGRLCSGLLSGLGIEVQSVSVSSLAGSRMDGSWLLAALGHTRDLSRSWSGVVVESWWQWALWVTWQEVMDRRRRGLGNNDDLKSDSDVNGLVLAVETQPHWWDVALTERARGHQTSFLGRG